MELVLVFLLLILNFGISWFNAWSCGRAWADSKAAGGWMRFVVWCGAIMSACGFTWCYLIVAALALGALGWLPPEYVQGALELGYVMIIVPVLGSGLGITIHSYGVAWRRRTIGSFGVAWWNTFAQAYNTYNAIQALPEIFGHLGELMGKSKGDGKGKSLLLMILLVIMSIAGGILTTTAIIRATARKYSQAVIEEYAPRRGERRQYAVAE